MIMVYKIDNNKVKILTKDGECTLHITLDVNINFTGGFPNNFVNQNSSQNTIINSASSSEEEKTAWEIPDFKPTKNINFGK